MPQSSDNSSLVEDEQLTVYQHMDADKHWIGESLPPPSVDEVQYAGVKTAVGESPFPARADHSHDLRTRQTYASVGNKSVAASTGAYITGFASIAGWEDFLHPASTQLFDFPLEGVYIVTNRVTIARSTGVFPATLAYVLNFNYTNATNVHEIEYGNLPEGRIRYTTTIAEIVSFGTITGTQNLQFFYQNNDTVAHNVSMRVLIQRSASSIGAESD